MQYVSITYTNYKGETRDRVILPGRIWFGWTKYHPDNQWLLDAYDVEKGELRSFAMKDITAWKPKEEDHDCGVSGMQR